MSALFSQLFLREPSWTSSLSRTRDRPTTSKTKQPWRWTQHHPKQSRPTLKWLDLLPSTKSHPSHKSARPQSLPQPTYHLPLPPPSYLRGASNPWTHPSVRDHPSHWSEFAITTMTATIRNGTTDAKPRNKSANLSRPVETPITPPPTPQAINRKVEPLPMPSNKSLQNDRHVSLLAVPQQSMALFPRHLLSPLLFSMLLCRRIKFEQGGEFYSAYICSWWTTA
jgi:hypothetical protein